MKKIKLKKKNKSNKWLLRHLNDEYLLKAKINGYRSRSAFKLIQINKKFNFFFKDANVIDLGAAPGGWSQVANELVKPSGKILSFDKLVIEPIDGVKFIDLDLYNIDEVEREVKEYFGKKVDIILSDMAPNTTGHKNTDHTRIISLAELAINLTQNNLKKGGFFVCKIFQGGAQGELLLLLKNHFQNIKYYKPNASRQESTETYLCGIKK